MLIVCPSCGKKISPKAHACPDCGHPGPFDTKAPQASAPQASAPAARGSGGVFRAGFIVLAVLCLGALAYVLFGGSAGSSTGASLGGLFSADESLIPVGPVGIDEAYGYVNRKGEWVIAPRYEAVNPFGEDKSAWVQYQGKYGRIDAKGEWVTPPQFEDAYGFAANGLASAKVKGQYGYIDAKGQWVIPPQFEFAGGFSANGLARVEVKGQYGYIDAKGQWVIPPQFEFANSFADNGLASVEVKGQYGYIDTKGQWVIPPQVEYASGFAANGLAFVLVKGQWGYIDAKGEWVIPPQFERAEGFADNGLAKVEVKGQRGYIDANGDRRVLIGYDPAHTLPAGFAWRREGGRRLLVGDKGNTVLSLEKTCDMSIAKNARDEIIWPQNKSLSQICDEKTAQDRYQRQKEEEKRQAEQAQQCAHVYVGKAFTKEMHYSGLFALFEGNTKQVEVTVIGLSPQTGDVTVQFYNGVNVVREEWSCSYIPR